MFINENKPYLFISNNLEVFNNDMFDIKQQIELVGINKNKTKELGTICVKFLNFYDELIFILNRCVELTEKPFIRIEMFLQKKINLDNKELIELLYRELHQYHSRILNEIIKSSDDLKMYEKWLVELKNALINDECYETYYNEQINEIQQSLLNNKKIYESEKMEEEIDKEYLEELEKQIKDEENYLEDFKKVKEDNKTSKDSIKNEIKDIENNIVEEKKKIKKTEEADLLLKKYIEKMINDITNYKNFFDSSCGFMDKKNYNEIDIDYFVKMFSSKLILPQTYIYKVYEEYNFITPIDRFIFNTIKNKSKKDLKRNTLEDLKKTPITLARIFEINSVKEILDISLSLFVENKFTIKKCKNCGKYFIPHNKQVYCDNQSPQNPNKTCKNLTDDLRDNKNPIYEVYRNNYKTQSNKKRRNKHIKTIENKFNEWNKRAREEMEKCILGEMTLDEYKQWHKNNQDWIKKF